MKMIIFNKMRAGLPYFLAAPELKIINQSINQSTDPLGEVSFMKMIRLFVHLAHYVNVCNIICLFTGAIKEHRTYFNIKCILIFKSTLFKDLF